MKNRLMLLMKVVAIMTWARATIHSQKQQLKKEEKVEASTVAAATDSVSRTKSRRRSFASCLLFGVHFGDGSIKCR